MKIEHIRHWLTKNKIFFEVFASTFLGIGGVGLAIASYVVSKENVKLTEAQIYPSIFPVHRQSTTSGLSSDEILIVNAGGAARNLKISTVSLLDVVTDKTGSDECITLTGYFDTYQLDSTGSEVIATVARIKPGNHSDLVRLAPIHAPGQNPLYESATVTTLLKLEYIKIGGEKVIQHFSFNYNRQNIAYEISPRRFFGLPKRCQYTRRIENLTPAHLNHLSL